MDILDFMDFQRLVQVLVFFAQESADSTISRLKAMKLLWAVDRFHMRNSARPVLRDTYYAMPHGPVPSKALTTLNSPRSLEPEEFEYLTQFITIVPRSYNYLATEKFDRSLFSDSEIRAMNHIQETLGQLTASELRKITHKFPEWARYKEEIEEHGSRREPIVMEDFFDESGIREIDEIFDIDRVVLNAARDVFITT